jgi:hypothetical protein
MSTGASGGGFVVRSAYAQEETLERDLTSVIPESYACGQRQSADRQICVIAGARRLVKCTAHDSTSDAA